MLRPSTRQVAPSNGASCPRSAMSSGGGAGVDGRDTSVRPVDRRAARSRGRPSPCSSSRGGRRRSIGVRPNPPSVNARTRDSGSSQPGASSRQPCHVMSAQAALVHLAGEEARAAQRSGAACGRRSARLKNRRGRRCCSTQRPVEPAELVVLAVGVVVAALRAADLVAGDEHRHALREQQDRSEVLDLAARGAPRSPGRRSRPRRRSSSSGCRRCRRGCPRRWPRCACRCTRRGR